MTNGCKLFLDFFNTKIFAKNKKQTKEYRKYFNTLIKIQERILKTWQNLHNAGDRM